MSVLLIITSIIFSRSQIVRHFSFDLNYINLNQPQNQKELAQLVKLSNLHHMIKYDYYLFNGAKIECATPSVDWSGINANIKAEKNFTEIEMPPEIFDKVLDLLRDTCAMFYTKTFNHMLCIDKFFMEFDDTRTFYENRKKQFELYYKGISNTYLPYFLTYQPVHENLQTAFEKIVQTFICNPEYCETIFPIQIAIFILKKLQSHILYISGYTAKILANIELISGMKYELLYVSANDTLVSVMIDRVEEKVLILSDYQELIFTQEYELKEYQPYPTISDCYIYKNILVLNQTVDNKIEQILIYIKNKPIILNVESILSYNCLVVDLVLEMPTIINFYKIITYGQKVTIFSDYLQISDNNLYLDFQDIYIPCEFLVPGLQPIYINNKNQTVIQVNKSQNMKIHKVVIYTQNNTQTPVKQLNSQYLFTWSIDFQLTSFTTFKQRKEENYFFNFNQGEVFMFELELIHSLSNCQIKLILKNNTKQSLEVLIGQAQYEPYFFIKGTKNNFNEYDSLFQNETIHKKQFWIYLHPQFLALGTGIYVTPKSVIVQLPHNDTITQIGINNVNSFNVRLNNIMMRKVGNLDFLSPDFKSNYYNKYFNFNTTEQYTLTYTQIYESGTYCAAVNRFRQTRVLYKCGQSIFQITDVQEVSTCNYDVVVTSSYFCLNYDIGFKKIYQLPQRISCHSEYEK